MSLVTQYIDALKSHLIIENKGDFEKTHGASQIDLVKLQEVYPLCPKSLIELLTIVDGTYHRQYDKDCIAILILGSDLYEYPYYLLSTQNILDEAKASDYSIFNRYMSDGDTDDDLKEIVEIDPRIDIHLSLEKRLCFSHCMNNGGTSELYIDFNPLKEGKIGQVIQYVHDPDSYTIIADNFDEYLQKIIDNDFNFIEEDE